MPVKCKYIYIYIYFGLWPFFTGDLSFILIKGYHSTSEGGGGWATGPKRRNPWWLPAVSEGLSGCLPTLGSGHLLPCVKWPQFQALTLFFFWNYFLFISTRYQCLSVHADTTRMSVWPGSQVTATRVAWECFRLSAVRLVPRPGCLWPVPGGFSSSCAAVLSRWPTLLTLFSNLTTFCGQKCKNSEEMWRF